MRIQAVARLLLPLLLLGVGVGGFVYLKSSRPEQPKAQASEKVWQVRTQVVEPSRLAPVITLYGEVFAPDELQAAAPGTAVVAEVPVREGETVAAGQLLASLDRRDFLPQLRQAEAEVAELEAQISARRLQHANDLSALAEERDLLALARAAVVRAERLKSQQLGADSTLDQAREALVRQQLALASRQLAVDSHDADLAQLEARRARALAGLTQAQRDLERSRILAPYPGVVTAVNVSAGDRVSAGSVLLRLYALEDLEVRARIPARYQAEIQAAVAQGQTLRAQARLADVGLVLQLRRLAGAADPSGVDGLFGIESNAGLVRPGNLLKLELQRPAQDGLIALPMQAIYGNSRVYLLSDGRLRGVDVEPVGQLGDSAGRRQLLVRADAIEAGAELVVTHLPNAIDGLKVSRQP